MLNGWEIVLAFGIILILFGAKKLPELARGLGEGMREFKKSTSEASDEVRAGIEMNSVPEDESSPSQTKPSQQVASQ